jgi:hypothetical protein
MFWSLGWSWWLILLPFCHEVEYCWRLDGCAWIEVDIEGAEFSCLVRDSSSSVLIAQNVTERVVGDDSDRVLLEVVS